MESLLRSVRFLLEREIDLYSEPVFLHLSLTSQHTPRVNEEIPDVNDATLDHERLSEKLATYGLAELQIEGDGNCQISCFATLITTSILSIPENLMKVVSQ
ncbi:OVARIAN TUMOR DOMAIN-containing deubiquitinating enzyme 12-like isoform X2 [Actinidia eriantha]|uniref:OVARIAN TUMOR DOMAIN-containing deubiquitinating enzyme 12-like isoform X2 n=1 Tax=Actinidia eriantha TaxID=165200 RepID=UPI002590985E|nr:OVARIAN TUMOR DOMAIN-containing deubiquitinating enzyme 12-like isoform X2 [Actinidia eriantha]XP_057473549.1 OVARIAN TUMOR DOMAIN-containing deubiquitinating enzyme 12-like isoform X2 [Actinidia eriantha]